MTIESESTRPAPSARTPEGHSPESDAFAALLTHCAARLEQQAEVLVRRWEEQSRSVEIREGHALAAAREAMGVALVRAAAGALISDAGTTEDAVSIGLAYGADAFARGIALQHVLRGVDLLEAIALFAIETDLAGYAREGTDNEGALAAGVRVARRLRRFWSLAVMAAAKGYTQAVSDEMQDRFRHLRHDLRNPLGTIKSVLTLMDDPSVPPDARTNPRFRTIASRNARTLDELIATRLSDVQAMHPALAHQMVSLRAVACSVRRELRAEADARGVAITVDADPGRARIDAVGLELLLHEVLRAALRDADEGEELHVAFEPISRTRIAVRVEGARRRIPVRDADALARLHALATRIGGRFHDVDAAILELPAHGHGGDDPAPERREEPSIAPTRGPLRSGESRHDLGSAGERDDRQPRVE